MIALIAIGSVIGYLVGVGVRNEMLPPHSSYRLGSDDGGPEFLRPLFWPAELVMVFPFRLGSFIVRKVRSTKCKRLPLPEARLLP